MRILKASVIYFAAVFGVGFVLGTLRVLFVVPALGVRWAELLELPLMVMASFFFARLVVHRFAPLAIGHRLAIGSLALVLLVATELGLAVLVQDKSLAEYVAGRDPVSGIAYLLSLVAFGLMPLLVGNGQSSNNSFKPKPLRGSA
jgi:hypothetical protein